MAASGPGRDEVLRQLDLRQLIDDPAFIRISQFAARLCDAPIALVSFVEEECQWFPARTGLEARQTPRETSFCAYTMQGSRQLVVPDARLDERFSDNPLVLGDPHIRFYAGAPIVLRDGTQVGALCVIDRTPRSGLTDVQAEGLAILADTITEMLNARRSSQQNDRDIEEREAKFRILADAMPQMVWSTLPDGYHDYYNARWYEFTGMPIGSTDGEGWAGMFHPDDQQHAWDAWRHSLRTGEPYEVEYRLRNAHGEYRWTLGRALPIRDQQGAITRWFGTCTDIHDQRMIQVQRELVSQELSHRIKNIFSVISGLITFSARFHPEIKPIAVDLRERILALGRAHDFVRPHSDASRPTTSQDSLTGMLRELLNAYGERIVIEGRDIAIDDRSATPLALVFHELATNAAKYGALSSEEGSVRIHCDADGDQAVLEWIEQGGPKASQPATEGFGSKLVQLSIGAQLGGSAAREWLQDGLLVTLKIPQASMHRTTGVGAKGG
ncbi:MAG: PAS domain S-box protein [Burkholderiales bacterium]|nr:MAG: PAS domain S-box protein [Burkholderiales bacterium]